MKPISSYEKSKIDIKKFKLGKKISHGGFGIVYKVEEIETKNLYAAKIISYDDDEETLNNLIDREVSMMINVQHPTIIKFIGYSTVDFNNDVSLVIFMELAPNGSLSEVIKSIIRSNGPKDYTNTSRQIILIGVSRGMKYLHDRNIIHRDLKPGNILLNSYFQPLLTDFGMAKYFEVGHSHSQSQFGGTKPYQAPEILKGEKYDGKVDVYAFGILMFEILTDSFAYPELYNGKLTDFAFQSKVINNDYRPVFPFPINENLQKLIEECWSKNPDDRPSFGEIFEKLCNEDYFLEDVDADEISLYVDNITEITDSTEKLLDKIKVLRKQNSILKTENDKNISKIDKLEKENLHLKEEIYHLKQANETVECEKQELNKIVIQLKEENENNSKKINDFIKDIQQYQEANLKLKTENNQIVSKIKSSENDKKKLQMEINKLKKINKKYIDKIAQLNDETKNQKIICNQNSNEKDDLNDENKSEIVQDIEDMLNKLEEYNPDRQLCLEALQKNNYDLEQASEYLLTSPRSSSNFSASNNKTVSDYQDGKRIKPHNNPFVYTPEKNKKSKNNPYGLTDEEVKNVLKEKPQNVDDDVAFELFIDANKDINAFISFFQ